MVNRFAYAIGVLLAIVTYSSLVEGQSQRLDLQLRDGAVVTMEVDSESFQWRDVEKDLSVESIRWDQIERLTLAETTAQSQRLRLNDLLDDLANDSYALREKADECLSEANFSGPYKSLLVDRLRTTKDFEVKLRLRRILGTITQVAPASDFHQFDRVLLSGTGNEDPKSLNKNGDTGEFVVKGRAFGGQAVELNRKQIVSITPYREVADKEKANATFTPVKTLNQIDRNLFNVDSELISFEVSASGAEIPVGKTVNDMFVASGLRMRTESAGYLQLIKYPFRLCPIESGDRCVCPYDANSDKKLRGVSVFTFCVPGQPNATAGVSKFGVFLERVEHSRDVVVEAYNRHGQLVGMVEATDQVCVFAGFLSENLITKVRISKNDTLLEVDRTIDETYAFDCVFIDTPRPLPQLAPSAAPSNAKQTAFTRVNMKTGDELIVDQVRIGEQDVAYVNPYTGKREATPWVEVDSIAHSQLANHRAVTTPTMVQLADGSILRTDSTSLTSSFDFIGHEFAKDQIVGAWMGTCRLPYDIEVNSDKPIIVFPSSQIVAEKFELLDDGFVWDNETSVIHLQKVHIGDLNDPFEDIEEPVPDPIPNTDRFSFPTHAKTNNSFRTAPSVWLSSPSRPDPKLGFIHFTDGQYLVLNSELGFNVTSIDQTRRSMTVEIDGTSKTFPLSRIRSLSLRQK